MRFFSFWMYQYKKVYTKNITLFLRIYESPGAFFFLYVLWDKTRIRAHADHTVDWEPLLMLCQKPKKFCFHFRKHCHGNSLCPGVQCCSSVLQSFSKDVNLPPSARHTWHLLLNSASCTRVSPCPLTGREGNRPRSILDPGSIKPFLHAGGQGSATPVSVWQIHLPPHSVKSSLI